MPGPVRQLVKCGGVVPTFIVKLRFCRQLDEILDWVVPAPAAWFMEERAPDLPQRMLNELSASPATVIRD